MKPGLTQHEQFKTLGEHAVSALDAWLRQKRRNMRLDDWIIAGDSGGKVALVYLEACDGNSDSWRLVLKLCPPGDNTEYEPANSTKAWRTANGFEPHLLEPFDDLPVFDTGWWLMFQRVAQGGMRGVGPLSRVPDSQIAAAYTAVVRPLLKEWAGWSHQPSMQVSEFLTRQLGPRIEPDGGVHTWARYQPKLLEDPAPVIEIAGDLLPNPFALVRLPSPGTLRLQQVFVGKAHGDLHPGNILLPLDPQLRARRFVLVDLARYRDNAPLAQDPAQLLLCLVGQRFLSGTSPQREALNVVLAGPNESGGTLVPDAAATLIKRFWELSALPLHSGPER